MDNAKRVIFNTGIIYAKTIVTIAISLYSTRLLLSALGAEDFGLFNVIGGLISMLAFLNAAMAVSTQRFMSFNIGSGNSISVKKIFANSVTIHFFIGVVLVIVFEVLGVYFLNYKLKIDSDRLLVANMVFHFVVASTFITIVSVPYDAIINAHEDMTFLAVTSIIESVLKLLIAIYLLATMKDKLLVYGLLLMLSTLVIRIVKRVYVRRRYTETHVNYIKEFDCNIIKKMSSFAGWNLFGSFSYIARNEGMAILLNLFFITVVNAAFGIANQVAGQLSFFCSSMLQAINPQIMKSEGAMDRDRMFYLAMMACKLGFLLLAFLAIPCISEMSAILHIWLKSVPPYTISFCILILIASMVNQLTVGLDSAIQATGVIRNYMLFAGGLKLLVLPFAYLLLRLKFEVYNVFILYSFFEMVGGLIRIYILKRQEQFSVKRYISLVLKPVIPVVMITVAVNAALVNCFTFKLRWMLSIPLSMLCFVVLAYFLSLSKDERILVGQGLTKLWSRISPAVSKKQVKC
jgi:Na+-driven multidrug efflux pump